MNPVPLNLTHLKPSADPRRGAVTGERIIFVEQGGTFLGPQYSAAVGGFIMFDLPMFDDSSIQSRKIEDFPMIFLMKTGGFAQVGLVGYHAYSILELREVDAQVLQIPSGHFCNGKSLFSMDKSTVSMVIFNSYVKLPEGIFA